jgi:hypothetical protein
MNKYVYSEMYDFPEIKTIMGKSYQDAVERLINKYVEQYENDEELPKIDNLEDLQLYMSDTYEVELSDLVDIDEL